MTIRSVCIKNIHVGAFLVIKCPYAHKFKGATKSYRKSMFVSATKIGKNTSNILNCCFSSQIHILAQQTNYLLEEN